MLYYTFLLIFVIFLHKKIGLPIHYKIINTNERINLIYDMVFIVGAWYTLTILTGIIDSVIAFYTGYNFVSIVNAYEQVETELFIISCIVKIFLVPVYEELFYRSYLLVDDKKDNEILIVSSFVFAVSHLNGIVIAAAYTYGYYCCKMCYKYKSIVPSIICHAMINAFAFVDKTHLNFLY